MKATKTIKENVKSEVNLGVKAFNSACTLVVRYIDRSEKAHVH